MQFYIDQIRLSSQSPIELIDLTARLRDLFALHPIRQGWINLATAHTTGFIAINEREPELQRDMLDFLRRIAPPGRGYRHDRNPVDDRPNTHAHLIGLFMNASETILVEEGRLLLGDWQSVFFIELDGPRAERLIHVQIAGIT